MSKDVPRQFQHIVDQYRAAYVTHGVSEAAILVPKGRQHLRFEALTEHISADGFSILDYGCGLAHLKAYLDTRFDRYSYTGADLTPEFVAENRKRYPSGTFHLVSDPAEVPGSFDFITMSGIFNIRYTSDDSSHFKIVKDILAAAFAKARVSLSVDFMIDNVDWKQSDAYHQNLPELYEFARTTLSPRLRFNLSYMPYEFAMIVFKDANIQRPANIYASIDGA